MTKEGLYYHRAENYLYRLQSHEEYYFWVGLTKDSQAIWGCDDEVIEIIWFSADGNYRSFERIELHNLIELNDIEGISLEESCERIVREKFKLEDQTILVKRFWVEEINAGIEDFPTTVKEFLVDSSNFSEEEIANYEGEDGVIELWKSEGQFVFWWGQDFYVNSEGFIETS